MGDPMKGIESDVRFDFDAAGRLERLCDSSATQIEDQAGSRASYVTTATKDFQGFYSELFTQNANVAKADASELAAALRTVASDVRELVKEANEENKRRADAREWKRKHDDRNLWDKGVDFVTGGDDCPIPEPTTPINKQPSAPPARHRQPLSGGGGGGGTSSARPDDLRSFATGSSGLNEVFSGRPGVLSSTQSTFQSGTDWGQLDASGVFSAFSTWNQQNANDVHWARATADAFAAAGGSGSVSSLPNSSLAAALQAAGVNAARQDIAITMPTAIGHPPTTGYANDPVNTATGNFVETESDLEHPQATTDLWWRRSYNSVHDHDGPFGRGWSSWCEAGLSFTDEAAAFTTPDGRQVSFPRLGEGWDRAAGENLWLTREDDRLVVADNQGRRWVHTTTGRLVSTDHGEGTTVTARWDGERLVALSHERGRSISVEWDDAAGRITAVHASDGRSVSYEYDADGRLVAAGGPLGTRRYAWGEDGFIASVTDADGVVEVENVYDEHGRVVAQRSPFGRTTRFAYLPGRVTVVSDEDGTRANTWIADDKGRQVGVIDAHDQRQSTAYDTHGNTVMVTERDGTVTIRDYDERGRMVRQVVPDGADVTYDYDDADRVVRVEVTGGDPTTDERAAVTAYTYTGDQRSPSTITDPEGGVTRLEWAGGLMQEMTDPTGVVVRFGYDAHGELVTTSNDAQQVTRVERDAAGRPLVVELPSGARTRLTWSESGLPLTRTDPDGATWHYEHTAGGRLRTVVDPLGGRTEIEHDAAGERSTTVDPVGHGTHLSYDDLGNLAAVTLPDGARWDLVHDALGRLTSVTDPTGAVALTEYDVTGAPAAVVDPTGVRRELTTTRSVAGEYLELDENGLRTRLDVDRMGRLVSETTADGDVQTTRYDRCGRPVEIVDRLGGLTRMVRDAAGRVTTVVKPSGAEVGYGYDAAGRLETITDETGAVVRLVRDADGRVVEEHLPTGEVATTRYDACGRIVAQRTPGVGTTTCTWDAAGRMLEMRDPRSGRRTFGYDAAGRLVTATDGNGASTAYAYDANSRLTQITRPDGAVVHREYDALDRLVAETDPLGRRTTAEYDAAGRQTSQTDPTGSRTEWRYDDHGRLASVWVDGAQRSSIERDVARRRVRVTDRSGPDGAVAVHELTWDALGRLTSRTRDGRGPTWSYGADGQRVAMTAPDGSRVDYARDAAGRLLAVSHPLLGTASVERDAAGRMVSATAGGSTQRWTWSDGFLTGYEHDGALTRIEHDESGRITAVVDATGTTSYTFDEACQLVGAATRTEQGEQVLRWRYDEVGRLVAESASGPGGRATRELGYDLAGQLVTTRLAGEEVATYSYDGAGRRTREAYADGSSRDLEWRGDGWLSALVVTDRLGDTHRTDVVVDALGELARLGGAGELDGEVFTDSADPWSALLQVAGRQVLGAAGFTGHVDGTSSRWVADGWREARATGADPWEPVGRVGASYAAELTATGALLLAGLEWMGNRVYDAATHGFLSVDPLDPAIGAAWAGNPYSFAGNDPLHALDPLGLHPVTDAELREYNSSNGIGGFVKNNWEYAVAIGAVALGGVLVVSGAGGPLGMALISGGLDIAVQKYTTGSVNWGEVAVSTVAGGLGAGAGSAIAKAGLTGGRMVAANVAANAGVGAFQEGGSYVANNWGHVSARGLLGATAGGVVTGGAMGGSGALGEAAARNLSGVSARVVTHGTAALVDAAGGAGGSAVDQVISTGHVDAGDVTKSAGGSAVTGRAASGVEHYVGKPEAPHQGRHQAGPQHRAPTLLDYEPHAAGADTAIGTVMAGVLD